MIRVPPDCPFDLREGMLLRSLHAAEGTERRPVRRAWWPVLAAEPARDPLYRLFVQDAGAVPVVCGQAGGGHGGPAPRGVVGGGRARAVGVRDAEESAAVLPAPPGAVRRARARGLAWETVRELMVAATGEEGLRPGMVAVAQTAGDLANWHPHVQMGATFTIVDL